MNISGSRQYAQRWVLDSSWANWSQATFYGGSLQKTEQEHGLLGLLGPCFNYADDKTSARQAWGCRRNQRRQNLILTLPPRFVLFLGLYFIPPPLISSKIHTIYWFFFKTLRVFKMPHALWISRNTVPSVASVTVYDHRSHFQGAPLEIVLHGKHFGICWSIPTA